MGQFTPNDQVKKLIIKISENPNPDLLRKELYKVISGGHLLQAVDRAPAADSSGTITEQTKVRVLTTTGENGETYMHAFTHIDDAQKRLRDSGSGIIARDSIDLLRSVLQENYDGILLNGAGPWIIISSQDIQGIVDRIDA